MDANRPVRDGATGNVVGHFSHVNDKVADLTVEVILICPPAQAIRFALLRPGSKLSAPIDSCAIWITPVIVVNICINQSYSFKVLAP